MKHTVTGFDFAEGSHYRVLVAYKFCSNEGI
jgi:hypothetical protein